MKKLNFHVQGMTCASCEVLIERKLRNVPGVHHVNVSRSTEEAKVQCEDNVTINDLQAVIQEKGYTLSEQQEGTSSQTTPFRPFIDMNKRRFAEIGAVFLLIAGLYLILKQVDLLPSSFSITETMGYGFVFIIGLVAATSTCLAVAGGLLLAVANKYNEKYPNLTGWQRFKPHISFNIGRIASYTILGGAIGALGSTLTISSKVTGIIMIAAAVLMVLIGLQLLHIFPWLNKFHVKLPKSIAHKLYDASHASSEPNQKASFLFGASTFFLPCGFTQALQLYVLSKGDIMTGALTMLAFSLGTLPSLAAIGAFSSFTKGAIHRHFITFSAVLVIILGIMNIPSGVALTGLTNTNINLKAISPYSTAAIDNGNSNGNNQGFQPLDPNVKMIGGKQVVDMSVRGLGYYPHQFTVMEGIPVEWRIDGRQAQGCAQVITAPSIGVTEFLPKDSVKTVTFTPQKQGTIPFSCTMGMTTPGAAFFVVPKQNQNSQNNAVGNDGDSDNDNNKDVNKEVFTVQNQDAGCNPEYQECNVQKLSMEISKEKGFFPNHYTIKKGVPVELEIDAKIKLGGCMGTMVIPKYGVAHALTLGKTVLKFTPTEEGTFPFTCSMGSRMGEFVVTA
ncbi:sulfite exporter TauE/SafE family protein [Candidatus Woesearchaeota archaeon]|nr:sulfite exporter TauE/SafE family protein [Candidatus Woesearchaeota archaeon]